MTHEFILTSPLLAGKVIFAYDLNGDLKTFEVEGKLRPNQWHWLKSVFPFRIEYMKKLQNYKPKNPKTKVTLTIEQIPLDLSFDAFYKSYPNKHGKRKLAENTWNKLPKGEKVSAIAYIPKLQSLKKLEGTQMPYASTYLNQEYWKNKQ